MFIYRIEQDDGLGCYRFLDEIQWLQEHNKFNGRPCPAEDKGIERGMEEEEICGFKDLRQLKNWFKLDEVKKLREEGFTIRKIEVEKITAYGEKQVLAIRQKSMYEFVDGIEINRYNQLQEKEKRLL